MLFNWLERLWRLRYIIDNVGSYSVGMVTTGLEGIHRGPSLMYPPIRSQHIGHYIPLRWSLALCDLRRLNSFPYFVKMLKEELGLASIIIIIIIIMYDTLWVLLYYAGSFVVRRLLLSASCIVRELRRTMWSDTLQRPVSDQGPRVYNYHPLASGYNRSMTNNYHLQMQCNSDVGCVHLCVCLSVLFRL